MGERVRAQIGSALPDGERQGAPGPVQRTGQESMSIGIRNLLLAWGEGHDPRDDDERLAAIRRGPRFFVPSESASLDAVVHLPQQRGNQGTQAASRYVRGGSWE